MAFPPHFPILISSMGAVNLSAKNNKMQYSPLSRLTDVFVNMTIF
jgi:hypothetical protein